MASKVSEQRRVTPLSTSLCSTIQDPLDADPTVTSYVINHAMQLDNFSASWYGLFTGDIYRLTVNYTLPGTKSDTFAGSLSLPFRFRRVSRCSAARWSDGLPDAATQAKAAAPLILASAASPRTKSGGRSRCIFAEGVRRVGRRIFARLSVFSALARLSGTHLNPDTSNRFLFASNLAMSYY